MAGTKAILDLFIVPGALIFVLHQQRDRRAGGLAFEHAGQDTDRIRLAALAGVLRGSRPPAVNIDLQIRLRQIQSRRAAVHHTTQRGAMTLPKTGYGEYPTEGIARHALVSPVPQFFRVQICRIQIFGLQHEYAPAAHRNPWPDKRQSRKSVQQSRFGIADLHDQDALILEMSSSRGKNRPYRIEAIDA